MLPSRGHERASTATATASAIAPVMTRVFTLLSTNAAADALGPGALGPVRVLVTFPDGNSASAPAKEPLLQKVQQRMAQAPSVVTVQPAVFGNDYRSALVSAVLLSGCAGGPRLYKPAAVAPALPAPAPK